MTRPIVASLSALMLAACSSQPADNEGVPDAAPSATPTDAGGAPGRAFEFTRLSQCKTVKEEVEEGQYLEQDCPGIGGYTLKASVGDLRAGLHVIDKADKDTGLELSRIGGGGFSALGETLEWRGPEAKPLAPDALIFRYNVVEDPESNQEVSYLLVARLTDTPCVIAKVPPGPGQNAKARDLADQGGACIAG